MSCSLYDIVPKPVIYLTIFTPSQLDISQFSIGVDRGTPTPYIQ